MAVSTERLDEALARAWQREHAQCAASPEYYIFRHVRTKDEHDRHNPCKPFPDWAYLRILLRRWVNGDPEQFTVKSRQLMVSWLAVAYVSWLARFHEHQAILFRSKKEQDAAKMVFQISENIGRLSFIETHLPLFLRLPVQYSYGMAAYPNGSTVEALPQGAEGPESRVPSLVVDDECSLQDKWTEGYAAALPCVDGGGQYIGISTVRMPSDFSEEVKGGFESRREIYKGISIYRSSSNVMTTAVHYSADPAKDPDTPEGKAWYERVSSKWPKGGAEGVAWRQHMEMDFEAISGAKLLPWLGDYEHIICIDPIPIRLQQGWTYSAGFDYGKRNPSTLRVSGLDPDGTKYQVWEMFGSGQDLGGIRGMARRMKECPYWPHISHRIQADPTIWNENQAQDDGTYTSIGKLFEREGVYMQRAKARGQNADDVAIERLVNYYWEDPGNPRLFIFNHSLRPEGVRRHTGTIEQFKQLRFKEWSEATQDEHGLKEELVDRNNDTFDAFKYEEVNAPSPAEFATRTRPGTAQALIDQIIAEQYQGQVDMIRQRPA